MRIFWLATLAALAAALPAHAESWIDTKTSDAFGLSQNFVDKDSISKQPDGRYDYRTRSVITLTDKPVTSFDEYRVNCSQDMSDDYLDVSISENNPKKPGWKDNSVTAGSGTGKIARYVCFTLEKIKPVKAAVLPAADKALCDALGKPSGDDWAALVKTAHPAAICNAYGEQPLHLAAIYDRVEAATLLLAAGAPVDGRAKDGETPLMLVESTGMADLLLAHGASVSARDKDGNTPLAEIGVYSAGNTKDGDTRAELARRLIEHHADVNAANNAGETPLVQAARSGRVQLVVVLLGSGANPKLLDKKGKSAVDGAKLARTISAINSDRPDLYSSAAQFDVVIAYLRDNGTPETGKR